LSQVTRAAFGQRRKMLRQSLKSLPKPGLDVTALLARAGIEETRRAEEIDIGGFVALAQALAVLS
jgi:16S rRNA (adenine1518-N6/adenine1519-N6)-dimethyltransferase